jgi:uncharacterized membrane-anchored protein
MPARDGYFSSPLSCRRALPSPIKASMAHATDRMTNKVPEVTLAFWIIKIAATTLGETAGDALSMSLHLGYAVSTVIFFSVFIVTAAAQITAKRFHPYLYWSVIVATTTTGTTLADFADRSLGIGYVGGSTLLLLLLLAVLGLWRWSVGSIAVNDIHSPRVETYYWAAILASNTLGTALGDFMADSSGFGYEGSSFVFAGALALIAAAYFFTRISHTTLFWSAFILTRPLGATVGDLLTKPVANGGLDLSRVASSLVIAGFMIAAIALTRRRSPS